MKTAGILLLMSFAIFAFAPQARSLQPMPHAELQWKVGDPCGATTNMVWNDCEKNAKTCEEQSPQFITIDANNIKIPGTQIYFPFNNNVTWTIRWGTCGSGLKSETTCSKSQHEVSSGAPGSRSNHPDTPFPPCTGTYKTIACKQKIWGNNNVNYDAGCEEDPVGFVNVVPCPNQYNLMQKCN